jgi:asparagine synthase (glutamine-hydrolysing)
MSAIAVTVEWANSNVAAGSRRGLEAALASWKGDAIRVARCPGAQLGISWLTVDESGQRAAPLVVDEGRRLAVVADCRFDDRSRLLGDLGLGPDASDVDLIVAAHQRWGDDFPDGLVGDFAGVLWDWGRQRCLAFRDHLGVRPLFYCLTPTGVTVASDVEMVVRLAGPSPVPDDQAVVEHLLWEYASTDRTFWAAVSKLPAGHVLIADAAASARRSRYWRPNPAPIAFTSMQEVDEEFQRLFVQSVSRRVGPSGVVLAHLSGGIDSSLIVCVANQLRRQAGAQAARVAAVSQRFPGQAWDEERFIAAVRDWTAVESYEWNGREAEFLDLTAPSLAGPGMRAWRSSGSLGDLDIAGQRSARVILSGEGGDQLGLPWGLADSLVAEQPLGFARDTLLRNDLSLRQRVARARRLLRRAIPPAVSRLMSRVRARRALPPWLHSRWRGLGRELIAGSPPARDVPPFAHEIQRAHWHQLTSGRTAFALDLQQLVAGRRGVEMRFPYLDRDLVQLVLGLGPAHWPRGRAGARLHREAMGSWLPPQVRWRADKAVFSGAVGELLKRSVRQLDALFNEGEWLCGDYVIRREAQDLLRRALAAPQTREDRWEDHEREWLHVRSIATLEAWLRAVFGYATPGEGTSDAFGDG